MEGVLGPLAFYVHFGIYIRIIALNDLKLQKFYVVNNDTYVDIANCFSSNLEEISMFEITTLIRQRMEIEQTPLRVNRQWYNRKETKFKTY